MKNVILILMIGFGSLLSFNVAGNSVSTETSTTQNNSEIVETPRRPGNGKMRRPRYKIFNINVGHYNRKIKSKYDKEMKAYAENAKSNKEKRAEKKVKRDILRAS